MKLKVSNESDVKKVAGCIAKDVRSRITSERSEHTIVQAVGSKAVNQSIKAIGIANDFLKEESIELFTKVSFVDIEFADKTESGILFTVYYSLGEDYGKFM